MVIPSPRTSSSWIISRESDLSFLIGGFVLGYLMFYLHAGLHLNMLAVWFAWFVLLDSPHFFATYSRTYFDRQERCHRSDLLKRSLLCFLVGPLILGICSALAAMRTDYHLAPFLALIAAVNLWGYWHVVRQHYGIIALYRRKNDDAEPIDRHIDNALLYIGLWAPLVGFVLRNNEARQALFLPRAPLSNETEQALYWSTVACVGVVIALFIARQLYRLISRRRINIPKVLLLAGIVPLHVFVCYHTASSTVPLLGFLAFVTIHHDVQYLALVWFYQRNRCHSGTNLADDFGLASFVTKRIWIYLGLAVLMGLLFGYAACLLEINPGCSPIVQTHRVLLLGNISLQHVLCSVFLGFLMHHYLIDQYIWRPSREASLIRTLKLT